MDIKMEWPNMASKGPFQFSSRGYKSQFQSLISCNNASINIKPEGEGTWAYVRHLTFTRTPPWDPKIWSDQIKYPHHGEVISHKFI